MADVMPRWAALAFMAAVLLIASWFCDDPPAPS